MFTARYYNRSTGAEYYRTVWGDTINEAMRAADRYARKGFIVASVSQKARL